MDALTKTFGLWLKKWMSSKGMNPFLPSMANTSEVEKWLQRRYAIYGPHLSLYRDVAGSAFQGYNQCGFEAVEFFF